MSSLMSRKIFDISTIFADNYNMRAFASHDELRDRFKKRLEQLLDKRGLSTEISVSTGIPRTSISTWKSRNKTAVPDVIDGAKLARICGTTVECLVFGDSNEYENKTARLAYKYEEILEIIDGKDEKTLKVIKKLIEAVSDEDNNDMMVAESVAIRKKKAT